MTSQPPSTPTTADPGSTRSRPRRSTSSAVWLVLASIVAVQVGAAVGKGLFGTVEPLVAAWLRLTTAALVLLAVVRPWRRLPRRATTPLGERPWLLLLAFALCLVGMNVTIYLAFAHIPIGIAVTIEFLGPLAVAVVGSRRLLDLAWVVLAGFGVALLGFSPGRVDVAGVVFALLAGLCWGCYIVVGRPLGRHWRGADALAWACAAGSVALLPVALTAGPALLSPRVLATGAAVGLLSTCIPYTLELRALKTLPRPTFGILMSLEPAAAALAALLILHERLTAVDVVAMACVVAASLGSTRAGRNPAADAPAGPGAD